jgi:hypothetical protein
MQKKEFDSFFIGLARGFPQLGQLTIQTHVLDNFSNESALKKFVGYSLQQQICLKS